MGSPFLLAHGLGVPVKDATTTLRLPQSGTYRLWVRTRDWVAPWKAPGAPGRFQVLLDGKPVEAVFGTKGANWHWQDGGTVKLDKKEVTLALHDLTGFEGRCDALVFSDEEGLQPPEELEALAAFRRKHLSHPPEPESAGSFDVVVVGGGIAGTCAALSAARSGLKVAFIQDRPVLGGNNSSEVRVWLQGARNKAPWPRIGDIVAELEQKKKAHYGPSNTAELYEDDKKIALVRAEKNISLFLEHRMNDVDMQKGRIRSVVAQHTTSGLRRRFEGRWFVDATGDGCLGFLAGADHEMTEKGHMGRCNLWHIADTGKLSPFPRCPWALDLSDKPFPGRGPKGKITDLGGWYWESGFDHDPFEKSEYIRDWNFRAMYGAWDCLKNVDKRYGTYHLKWAAHISGKRESRRLLGDIVLSKVDVLDGRKYPDGCVPTGWTIDLHLPDPRYVEGFEGDAYISKAHHTRFKNPYWIPYRCLYSRNVANLFMAGRDISVTHDALGTSRVMRTGGCMGEIVGMAAAVCKEFDVDPRGVYEKHLDALKKRMAKGVGKGIPPKTSQTPKRAAPKPPAWIKDAGPNLARMAKVSVSGVHSNQYPASNINDGRVSYSDNALRWVSDSKLPAWVELAWNKPQEIKGVRIVSGWQDGQGGPKAPITEFVLEYRADGQFRELSGTNVKGNHSVDWHKQFSPVTTDRVRLEITSSPNDQVRIWEIELY